MKNSTDLNEVPVLTDKETLEEVVDCLSQHISIETEGAFNQTDLFNILVRAASQKDTIEVSVPAFNEEKWFSRAIMF